MDAGENAGTSKKKRRRGKKSKGSKEREQERRKAYHDAKHSASQNEATFLEVSKHALRKLDTMDYMSTDVDVRNDLHPADGAFIGKRLPVGGSVDPQPNLGVGSDEAHPMLQKYLDDGFDVHHWNGR